MIIILEKQKKRRVEKMVPSVRFAEASEAAEVMFRLATACPKYVG